MQKNNFWEENEQLTLLSLAPVFIIRFENYAYQIKCLILTILKNIVTFFTVKTLRDML